MSSHTDRPKRSCRIIPAVPRQFEKKSTSILDSIKPSRTATPGMQKQGQAVKLNTDTTTLASSGRGYDNPRPPFDPVDRQNTPLSSPKCSDDTMAGKESEPTTDFDQVATELCGNRAADNVLWDDDRGSSSTPASVLTFGGNPTPPIEGPSTGVSWYPNPPFTSANPLSHYPTPPSNMDPSPADYAHQSHLQPDAISFYPPESQESAEASSSTYPFYQGYMYRSNSANHHTVGHFDGRPDHLEPVDASTGPLLYTYPPPQLATSDLLGQGNLSQSSISSGKKATEKLSQGRACTLTEAANPAVSAGEVSEPSRTPEEGHAVYSQGRASRAHLSSDGEGGSIATNSGRLPAYEDEGWKLQDGQRNAGLVTMPLTEFLLRHFNDPQYADCCMHVSYKDKQLPEEDLLLHSLLIARSPVLASKLASCERRSDGMLQTHFETSNSFVTSSSLQYALRTLYGEPLGYLTGRHSTGATSPLGEDSRTSMAIALAYAAAGLLLDLQEVTEPWMQIAAHILDWDNIDLAFSFVLDGYIDHCPGEMADSNLSTSYGLGTDLPPGKDTTDHAGSSVHPHPDVVTIASLRGAQDPQVSHLARRCLQFITQAFPSEWTLDLTAASTSELDRLPLPIITRPPPATSRFSHIQFGSLPPETPVGPNHIDKRISAILLSAPYVLLKDIFRCAGHFIGAQKTADIVTEREQRRQQVLKNKDVLNSKREECRDTWVAVGWSEDFDKTDNDGSIETVFTRRWSGFLNPLEA